MGSDRKWTFALLCVIVAATGCTKLTEVSTPRLIEVVERDAITFDGQTPLEEVLDRLAQYKVVVLGEVHFLQEHRQLVAELIRTLHAQGFRQLLFEWPQMADWILDDYVKNGGLAPQWVPPVALGGDLLAEIRAFNLTLPSETQFDVHGIDVNLDDYGGARGFLNLLSQFTEHLTSHETIEQFFHRDYGTPKNQRHALELLHDDLRTSREELIGIWGLPSFEMVTEMIDVELISVGVRALRDDHYDASTRLRENAIKRIAELRLTEYPHHTLINIGANHAQKKHLRGTNQEWLGEYLADNSPAVNGSVIVLAVVAAEIRYAGGVDDVLSGAPDNDVFRVMKETWPGLTVFLPLDDPIFSEENVPMISEGTVYIGKPKEHYDAFVLLPVAQGTLELTPWMLGRGKLECLSIDHMFPPPSSWSWALY